MIFGNGGSAAIANHFSVDLQRGQQKISQIFTPVLTQGNAWFLGGQSDILSDSIEKYHSRHINNLVKFVNWVVPLSLFDIMNTGKC